MKSEPTADQRIYCRIRFNYKFMNMQEDILETAEAYEQS